MPKTGSILYLVLRSFLRQGAKVFVSRHGITGLENFPKHKPVLLISNHQNAMLDPVLICYFSPKQLHWLTRADIFKNGLVKKLLHNFNMMPVYRERDGVGNMRDANTKIFEECYDRLEHHAVVSMFPEGTHRGKKQLIPFKKGLGRLAFGALESKPNMHDLVILPVGLDYSDFYEYHPEILIKFGKPIEVEKWRSVYQVDSAKAIAELMDEARSALSDLMIDVQKDELYDAIIQSRELCFELSNSRKLSEQFDFYQKFIKAFERDSRAEEMGVKIIELNSICKENGFTTSSMSASKPKANMMALILGFFTPVYLLARILFLPIEKPIDIFIKNKIKDPLFKNSLRKALWTFLVPIYLGIISIPIKLFTHCSWLEWCIGLLGILLAGRIAIGWLRAYRKFQSTNRWLSFQSKNSEKKKNLESLKKECSDYILSISK